MPNPDHTPQPPVRLEDLDRELTAVLQDGSVASRASLEDLIRRDPLLAGHLGTRLQTAGRTKDAELLYRLTAPFWPRRHGVSLFNNLTVLACADYRYADAWSWCRHALAQDPAAGAEIAHDLAQSVRYHGNHDIFWRILNAAHAIKPESIRFWSARYVEDSFRRISATPQQDRNPGPPPLPPRSAARPVRPGARPKQIVLIGRDFGNVASFNRLFGAFRRLPDHGYQVACLSVRADFDPSRAHMPEFTYHSVPERNPGAIEASLRALRPDVIIDLVSHGAPETYTVYAKRPAPLIIGWAGNGISSGTEMFDAFLTDSQLCPPGAERHYAEPIHRLPGTAVTVEPYPEYPDHTPAQLPLERNGRVTFGAYHRLSKLNAATLALWGRVLRALPESRLIIKTAFVTADHNRTKLVSAFAGEGVEPSRIDIRPMTSSLDHCRVVADTDITLTPFPEQGLVTDFDHLWMGVPAVALEVDDRPCARLSAALTAAAGAPFLATRSEDEYLTVVRDLANDPGYLHLARKSYRENLLAAGWTDHRRTGAAIAQAIEDLWRHDPPAARQDHAPGPGRAAGPPGQPGAQSD